MRGSASTTVLLIVSSFFAVAVLIFLALVLRGEGPLSQNTTAPKGEPLILYCASGMCEPTRQIIAAYEAMYPDTTIELLPGGSGTLYGTIQAEAVNGGHADLYLSAEWNFFDQGQNEGLIQEALPIGTQHPVLIVQRGNPLRITSLANLVADGAKIDFGIASPSAAIGNATREIAQQLGLWEALEHKRKTEAQSVTELAGAVQSGALDAAVVWNTTATMYDRTEVVQSTESAFAQTDARVGIAVLTSSKQHAEALRFARFLTSHDHGLPAFIQVNLNVVQDDE